MLGSGGQLGAQGRQDLAAEGVEVRLLEGIEIDPLERSRCGQAGPGREASRVPFHAPARWGGRQRRLPVGAAANGML